VGFALGYIYGGLVAAALGWRAAFFIAGGVMVPFVIFMFFSRPLHLHGTHDVGPDPTRPKGLRAVLREFAHDAGRVLRHGVWLNMVGGYTLYAAVIGVYAFWGPKAGKEIYNMKGTSADLVFGGVTVVTGVLGGLAGGSALDLLGATLRNANLVCAAANLGGLIFVLLSFLVARSFLVFTLLFALGELMLFCISVRRLAWPGWSGRARRACAQAGHALLASAQPPPARTASPHAAAPRPRPPPPGARRRDRDVVGAALAAAAGHLHVHHPDAPHRRRALAAADRVPPDAPGAGQAAGRGGAAVARDAVDRVAAAAAGRAAVPLERQGAGGGGAVGR
jgi:hypothetical protein